MLSSKSLENILVVLKTVNEAPTSHASLHSDFSVDAILFGNPKDPPDNLNS